MTHMSYPILGCQDMDGSNFTKIDREVENLNCRCRKCDSKQKVEVSIESNTLKEKLCWWNQNGKE